MQKITTLPVQKLLASDHQLEALKRLYGFLSPQRKRGILFVMALAFLGAIGEIVTLGSIVPFLALITDPSHINSYKSVFTVLQFFGIGQDGNILLILTLLFASVVLAAGAIRVWLSWETQKCAFLIGHELSVEAYRKTLCQGYSYHISKNSSELVAAVNKIESVVYGSLLQALQLVTSAIITFFIVAVLVAVNPFVAISAALGFAAIYLVVTLIVRRELRETSTICAAAQSERVKTLQEGLGGIRDVLIDQTQNVFITSYRDVDSKLRRAQAMGMFIGAAPRFVIESFGMVLIGVIAFIYSRGQEGLSLAIPVLGLLALGSQRLLPLLQQMYNAWTIIAVTHGSLLDVLQILDLRVDQDHAREGQDRPITFDNQISLSDMSFQYSPATPTVLQDISLTFRAGSRIGFIGTTGSGKSTLVDLIMGLLTPTSGDIRADGVPLGPDNVRAWQKQIAHVPQSIYLSDASISENIAFGVSKDKIDPVRLANAARGAKVDQFVAALPDGFLTVVGERGVRLSGGQRQRIGIARALYKQARILVFDEATSALDQTTEAAVMDAIETLDRELTIFVIAHRLSTLAFCDTIIKLEGGRVVSSGPPSAILEPHLVAKRLTS